MSYHIRWAIPDRFLVIPMTGSLSVEELHRFDREMLARFDASPMPLVHALYLVGSLDHLPGVRHLMGMKFNQHPRCGWALVTGLHNRVIRFGVIAMGAMPGNRIRFHETIEESIAFMCELDPTLEPLRTMDLAALAAQPGR